MLSGPKQDLAEANDGDEAEPLAHGEGDSENKSGVVGGGDGSERHQRSSLASEAREARDARARSAAMKRQGLASLQPRLQLWLGRRGAAAGVLTVSHGLSKDVGGEVDGGEEGRDVPLPWGAERRVGLEVSFLGFEDLATRPKV